MKKIAVMLLAASALYAGGLPNDREGRRSSCSTETLEGAYAISITGTRPAPVILPMYQGIPVGTIEQVIGVFLLVFDGDGSYTLGDNTTVKGSLSGLFPVFPEKSAPGRYSVNPDCTGMFTGTPPAPQMNHIVIFNGGEEFRGVVVSPQAVMVSVTAKKVARER